MAFGKLFVKMDRKLITDHFGVQWSCPNIYTYKILNKGNDTLEDTEQCLFKQFNVQMQHLKKTVHSRVTGIFIEVLD